jgi:hypothetical protein
VIGHFDPLLAAHARRLQELAVPGTILVVAVSDPPDPLLPAGARAELVAALAAVDYVVPFVESWPSPAGAVFEVFDERSFDESSRSHFVAAVNAKAQVS